VALALLLTVVSTVPLRAQPVSAHSTLESSTPGAGARIATMPASIDLTFVAAVEDAGATIVLADAHGDDWTADAPVVDVRRVSSPVRPGIPDGRYEIRWSATSIDGAPMSGVVRFALGTVVDQTDFFDAVLTAGNVAWIRSTAFVVVGVLFGAMAHGLVTVYGRRSARGPGPRP
jgi:methionine-rich copper-binding protein CopC